MKNSKLDDLLNDYNDITIPDDLLTKVEKSISKANKENMIIYLKKAYKGIGLSISAAAFLLVLLIYSNSDIAYAFAKIPVFSSLVKVVDIDTYRTYKNNMEANINRPKLVIEDETGILLGEQTHIINDTLKGYVDKVISQYESDVTEADGEGNLQVDLNYDVVTDNEVLYSIKMQKLIVMASGTESVKIYHIDKETGSLINLGDIFIENSDYINIITKLIKEQMRNRMKEDENITYWLEDEVEDWNFESIHEDTNFYFNRDNQLVIVFDEYEVAPGFMGSQEFVIDNESVRTIMMSRYMK